MNPLLPADLSEQLAAGLKAADIDALTPTSPEFIDKSLERVQEETGARTDELNLLGDEQN